MGAITIEQALKKYNKRYYSKMYSSELIKKFSVSLDKFLSATNKAVKDDTNEEFFKKLVNDFLEDSLYVSEEYTFNTHSSIDSVIKYNDNIRVLMEIKKPKNKYEMATENNINVKAFHEIILYYLTLTRNVDGDKAVRNEFNEIRRAVITDSQKWFIFDINVIENIVDGELTKLFYKYKNKQLVYCNDNDKFYEDISKYLDKIDINNRIEYVYFDINESYNLQNRVNIFKILKDSYLMKEFTKNDISYHILNNKFYQELLYIFGFKETNESGVSKIRIDMNNINSIAHQIYNIEFNDKCHDEATSIQNTFELAIIWMNRLLFIKLFEGRLIAFNEDIKQYHIIDKDKIKSFDDLYKLFFDILGKKERENDEFSKQFISIPYLNSSLFELYDIEKNEMNIKQMRNNDIKLKSGSVLESKEKTIKILDYIIDFLNSYRFGSYKNDKQVYEATKDIIDASVLGLIFEKLNGYQDGSFYTPSAITEYMASETIEKAIINAVNRGMEWECNDISEIRANISNKIDVAKKVNDIINTIRVCDISVGSGHFLISVLNQIIYFKKELGVLFKYGKDELLDEYDIEIEDDILCIINGQGKQFVYDKENVLSQKVQQTLFNEKRTIIENCIFGVDINPMAVSICQLRLWIELLKNAYYDKGIMETLPNIDINIKVGNSLINKIDFEVGSEVKYGINKKTNVIKDYKKFVREYKTTNDKNIKRDVQNKINLIKSNIYNNNFMLIADNNNQAIVNLDTENKLYSNAFEWAIEFPEIISENGEFVGFDCIIGNPPYIGESGHKDIFRPIAKTTFGQNYYIGKMDLFYFFFHRGLDLLKNNGLLSFITTNYYPTATCAKKLRLDFKKRANITKVINFNEIKVFESALGQHNMITFLTKRKADNMNKINCFTTECKGNYAASHKQLKDIFNHNNPNVEYLQTQQDNLYDGEEAYIRFGGVLSNRKDSNESILNKMTSISKCLDTYADVNQGVVSGCDTVTNKNIEQCSGDVKVKDGIFVLDFLNARDKKYYESLQSKEKELYKPFFKNSEIKPFWCNIKNTKVLFYADKNIKSLSEFQNIDKYMKKFNKILANRREALEEKILVHQLQWPRKFSIFGGEKIVVPYRTKTNAFAYNNIEWFCRSDCYIITMKNKLIDIKCLLALLNSSTYYFWLYNRGKRKGEILELFQKPLTEIPIPNIEKNIQNSLVELSNKIIDIKNNDKNADIDEYLKQINNIVYKIFDFSNNEIDIIEILNKSNNID